MMEQQCPMTKSQEVEETRDIVTCAICLELFENPRVLSCSHTYCLMCLRALLDEGTPTEYSRCPQCRAYSIPPSATLSQLPLHFIAKRLADLVREQDGVLQVEDDIEEKYGEELYAGEAVQPIDLTDKRSRGGRLAINVLKGAATIASLGIGGIYFGMVAAKKKRERQMMLSQDPFESFACGNCNNRQFYSENVLRYKCGMCEDFNLCNNCFSDYTLRSHRPDHILVKVKFRQSRRLPPGCVLKYRKARDMSDEIDFTSTTHSRAYYHTADSIQLTEEISCSFCAQSPIVGTRYKCGMCKDYDLCENCEEHSHQIHDPQHVFLVLRNRMKINITSEPLMKALLY